MSRLYPLICKRSKMSLRNKLTLYKTCIRPIMTYACDALLLLLVVHTKINLFQRVQNKFFRMASGCPCYVRNVDPHKDFDLELLKEFCKRLAKPYYERATPTHSLSKHVSTAPHPHVLLRRPHSVLLDPDDLISRNRPFLSPTTYSLPP